MTDDITGLERVVASTYSMSKAPPRGRRVKNTIMSVAPRGISKLVSTLRCRSRHTGGLSHLIRCFLKSLPGLIALDLSRRSIVCQDIPA